MNSEEIQKNIKSKDDDGLIHILANEKQYTYEAIECAKAEILKRKIDSDHFKTTYKKMAVESEEIERKANAELKPSEKIVLLVLPFVFVFVEPFVTIFFPGLRNSKHFHENGYKKKSSQVFNYMIVGAILWLCVGIVWSFRFVFYSILT